MKKDSPGQTTKMTVPISLVILACLAALATAGQNAISATIFTGNSTPADI
jgi:hypothetical protein